jgi:hypothetical protein
VIAVLTISTGRLTQNQQNFVMEEDLPDGLDNVDRNTNPLKLPSSITKFYWSWAR